MTEIGSQDRMILGSPRLRMLELLPSLSEAELEAVLEFAAQIARTFDPDAVHAFLRWREDDRLESILQIAARLNDADVDHLLFQAEDLLAESSPGSDPWLPPSL